MAYTVTVICIEVPQQFFLWSMLLEHLLQGIPGCLADISQQVMLGQHQQLSVHIGDDTSTSSTLLQDSRFPK